MTLHPFLNRIIHGDCVSVMQSMPAESVNLVVTDPPYMVNYRSRDGRRVPGDNGNRWLRPAFAEMHRVLRPGCFAVSFYGWNTADQRQAERNGFQHSRPSCGRCDIS